MELLGKSLEDIFESSKNKKFSLKTTCMLGIQMITILKYIHDKHIIHRDIKPDNFVTGVKERSKYIYLLDFGLAKKYRSSKSLQHHPMTQKKKLTGTARYASINALKGFEQSRRDDLESIGYVLVYFLLGKLPWQGLPIKPKEDRYVKIMEKKRDTNPEDLCKGLHKNFQIYIEYTRNLGYEENPDYDMLKKLFEDILNSEGFDLDFIYDWSCPDDIKKSESKKSNLDFENDGVEKSNNDIEKGNNNVNENVNNENKDNCKNEFKDETGINKQIMVVNNYVNHVNNIVINNNNNNNNNDNNNNNNDNKINFKKNNSLANRNFTNPSNTIHVTNNILDMIPSNHEQEINHNIKKIVTNQYENQEHTIETKNKIYKSDKCCNVICIEPKKNIESENENINKKGEEELIINDQNESVNRCCYIF